MKKLNLIDNRSKESTSRRILGKRIVKVVSIILIISTVLLLIAPYIAIPLFVNRHIDYRGYTTKNYPLQDIYYADDYGLTESQMYLDTKDGLKVWASEIYVEQPKAVIIYLTGIVQPSITYFYGHAKYMRDNGYASILLEVRGHGKSEGNQIGLGYKEVNDVQVVLDYIKSKEKYRDTPIVLHGVSMGGAIAINAFGQLTEIDALIAMSAYASFEDVILDILKNYGVPSFLLKLEKPLIQSALSLIYGSEVVDNLKPIKQIIKTNNRPALLIACTDDKGVPAINSQRLKEANPNVKVWFRDSWEHFIIKECDFKNMSVDREYCDKILKFLENLSRTELSMQN